MGFVAAVDVSLGVELQVSKSVAQSPYDPVEGLHRKEMFRLYF